MTLMRREEEMRFDCCFKLTVVLGCLLFLALAGCGSDENNPLVPKIPADELRTAPQRIALGDQEYALETHLWRDFMPISPPDGKPLIALLRVVEQNAEPIAPDLKVEYLWVINGAKIWATTLSDESLPPSPQNELQAIARGGPKWGPQIQVDVVVGLRCGQGSLQLLRAPNQWIGRTD
jgi:hypothetical protein